VSGLWTPVNKEKPNVRKNRATSSDPSKKTRLGVVSLAWLVTASAFSGLLSGTVGCGPRAPAVVPGAAIVVLVDTRGRRLPFDPDALRAKRAREAVDRVALHPIALAIDLALLPEDTEAREAYVADALEALARGLDAEKTRDAQDFAAGTSALSEVAFRFDPLARRAMAKLSDDGKTLVCGTSRAGSLPLTSEDFSYLFRKRAEDRRRAHYATKRPKDVPQGEREAYFRALEDHDDAPRDERARLAYLADRTLTLLELYDLASKEKAPLAAKVRHTLAMSGGDVLKDVAFHHPDLFDSAPRDSSVRRAEVAYSAFLRREMTLFSEEEALAGARSAFLRANPSGAPSRYVLPSFDRVGFAIETLSGWKRRGQTMEAAEPAVHVVVCPEERVKNGARISTSRSGYCGEELYRLAREDEGARKALLGYAKRADDAVFTRLLFSRLPHDREKIAVAFDAAREVSGTRLFPIAIEAMAESTSGTADAVFVSEARNLARALPGNRGDVAYLVSRGLMYRGSDETFTRFGDLFGAKLELGDFERFMTYGDAAVEATPAVIPAFAERTRGAPRMRVFLARLDAYLDHADERRARGGPDRTFSDLRDKLCAEDDDAGIAELARAFAERRKKHPGEMLTEIFADGCPKKDPSEKRATEKPRPPARKTHPMPFEPDEAPRKKPALPLVRP